MFSTFLDIYSVIGLLFAVFILVQTLRHRRYNKGSLLLAVYAPDKPRGFRPWALYLVALFKMSLFVNLLWPLFLSAAITKEGNGDGLTLVIDAL